MDREGYHIRAHGARRVYKNIYCRTARGLYSLAGRTEPESGVLLRELSVEVPFGVFKIIINYGSGISDL